MNTQDKAEIENASTQDDVRTVTLDYPIPRGETSITSVTIRRPYGSALQGLSISKLVNDADHDEFTKLIPRITQPMISKQDIAAGHLVISDFVQMIGEITSFFIPKWAQSTDAQTQ